MRTILITGASGGLVQEMIPLLKDDFLILLGRDVEKIEQLYAYHEKKAVFNVDIRDEAALIAFFEGLDSQFGQIDILVNNAGLALGLGRAPEADLDDWETMIDTNIKGLLYVTKAVLPIMVERKSGYIFNLGSIAGNWPYEGGNVYGATKAFVRQFSLNLRTDLKGTNIRVTNIEPGFAETEFSNVRFKGDNEKAAAVYKGTKALDKEDIANTIFTLSQLPQHVNVNTIEIMPTMQTCNGLFLERY